jgi:glycosyltransferase involved in cell wall biosynthesis
MAADRVSVVITSYNQEAYLKEAIDSVIQQITQPHEIIIADDHSTKDNSVDTIRAYVARYPDRVRAIFQKQNVGIPKNRNSALEAVTGDYVAILDGDDRLLPRFIEAHMAALGQHPGAGGSYSNRYNLAAGGERHIRNRKIEPSGDLLAYIAAGRKGILRSMIARYDLIKAAGLLDPAFYHHDGFILSLRLAKLTQFVYVAEPLMEKREHAEGTSKGISRREKVQCFEDVLSEIVRLTAELPAGQRRRIKEIWFERILTQRVSAELEAGKNLPALLHVAKSFAPDARRIRTLWKLARRIVTAPN